MICGKCHCRKENVQVTKAYLMKNGTIYIHLIPAKVCQCGEQITFSLESEIQSFLEKNKNIEGNYHTTYYNI